MFIDDVVVVQVGMDMPEQLPYAVIVTAIVHHTIPIGELIVAKLDPFALKIAILSDINDKKSTFLSFINYKTANFTSIKCFSIYQILKYVCRLNVVIGEWTSSMTNISILS